MKSPTGFNTGVKIEKRYFIYFLKAVFCKDFFLHLIQIVNWKSLSKYHHARSAFLHSDTKMPIFKSL